jgi:hypothetical protein
MKRVEIKQDRSLQVKAFRRRTATTVSMALAPAAAVSEDTCVNLKSLIVPKPPRITLTCDCGNATGYAAFGESWTCPSCGRTYDTTQIPSDDYAQIAGLDRRYRRIGYGVMVVLAAIVLTVALTGNLISTFAGLSVVLLSWFVYLRPLVHRKHKKAVAKLTRSWQIEGEPAAGD